MAETTNEVYVIEIRRKGLKVWRPWGEKSAYRYRINAKNALRQVEGDGYSAIWDMRIKKYRRVAEETSNG